MPITPVSGTQPTTQTSGLRPVSHVSPQSEAQLRAAADAYIANPLTRIQDEGLALYGTAKIVMAAEAGISAGTGVGNPVTDYGNPLKAGLNSAKQTAISSGLRNGVMVVLKKEDIPQAAGNVAGDVVTNTARSVAGAVATDIAIYTIARAGGSSFPIVAGGMVAGMVGSYATGKIIQKTGVRTKVAVATTNAVRKMMNHGD